MKTKYFLIALLGIALFISPQLLNSQGSEITAIVVPISVQIPPVIENNDPQFISDLLCINEKDTILLSTVYNRYFSSYMPIDYDLSFRLRIGEKDSCQEHLFLDLYIRDKTTGDKLFQETQQISQKAPIKRISFSLKPAPLSKKVSEALRIKSEKIKLAADLRKDYVRLGKIGSLMTVSENSKKSGIKEEFVAWNPFNPGGRKSYFNGDESGYLKSTGIEVDGFWKISFVGCESEAKYIGEIAEYGIESGRVIVYRPGIDPDKGWIVRSFDLPACAAEQERRKIQKEAQLLYNSYIIVWNIRKDPTTVLLADRRFEVPGNTELTIRNVAANSKFEYWDIKETPQGWEWERCTLNVEIGHTYKVGNATYMKVKHGEGRW